MRCKESSVLVVIRCNRLDVPIYFASSEADAVEFIDAITEADIERICTAVYTAHEWEFGGDYLSIGVMRFGGEYRPMRLSDSKPSIKESNNVSDS